jgi:hypothetical protein
MFNVDLVDDLARQKVVLFLGAGVSSSAPTRSGDRMKGWPEFLLDACKNIDPSLQEEVEGLVRAKDYLLACEILQGAYGDGWSRLIVSEYGQSAEPSELHKALIKLDQRIILTTNFDKLIESAWENKFGTSSHYPIVLTGIPDRAFFALKDYSRKYVVKIHGSTDDADNVVFSRSQYVKSAFANPLYSDFIDNLLLNYTLLFVGFSMDDPAIISLMESYSFKYSKSRSHYIFVGNETPERISEINKRLRKLVSIRYNTADNHKELPEVISQLAALMVARRSEIFAEMKVATSL